MRTLPLVLLLLAGCSSHPISHLSGDSAPSRKVAAVERRLAMMGTALEIRVEAADRDQALAASERAVAALEAAEARLSTWRDDSELSRLNSGRSVLLSPALAAKAARFPPSSCRCILPGSRRTRRPLRSWRPSTASA